MWYGFIIVDFEHISNKYHKMTYIPNFVSLEKFKDFGGYNYAAGANSGFKWYNDNQNNSGDLILSDNMVADFEGICGVTPKFANTNFMRFDAYNVEFSTIEGGKKQTPSSGEAFSVMFHMKTTSSPTGEAIDVFGICFKDNRGNNVVKVKLNKNNQLEATIGSRNGRTPGTRGPDVKLKSQSIINSDGKSQYAVAIVVDGRLSSQNAKLFINGNLEDQTGKALSTGTENNWTLNYWPLDMGKPGTKVYLGRNGSIGTSFVGTLEEICIGHTPIYPVVPGKSEYILETPYPDLLTNKKGESATLNAKLFLMDYHNISGKTSREICMSDSVFVRKTAFAVRGD
jgi:hypothetical protein